MSASGRRKSAGILLWRRRGGAIEVLLAHPGGPFWRKRDALAWGIPKGEIEEGEDALAAAVREFREETGVSLEALLHAEAARFLPLTALRQPSGKTVHAWAVEGDCDADDISSIAFSMEWPPRSGRMAQFPEVDRAGWFTLERAREKILPGQAPFLDELRALLRE